MPTQEVSRAQPPSFPPKGSLLTICPGPLLTFGALSRRALRAPQLCPPWGAESAVPRGAEAREDGFVETRHSGARGLAAARARKRTGLAVLGYRPAPAGSRSSPLGRHGLRRRPARALYKARAAALIRPRQRADSPPCGSRGAGRGPRDASDPRRPPGAPGHSALYCSTKGNLLATASVESMSVACQRRARRREGPPRKLALTSKEPEPARGSDFGH